LKEKLHYANEKTLAQRLADVLGEHTPEIYQFIGNPVEFAEKVKNNRNYYTHFDDELRRKGKTAGTRRNCLVAFCCFGSRLLMAQTYSYDFGGRLTGAGYADGMRVIDTYDTAGNISNLSSSNGATLPAQVTGMLMISNMALSLSSSTMVWTWAPAAYAAGYQVVLDQYLGGTWQTPTTNYTSATGYTLTGITPETPCEVLVFGANSAGVGPSCSPCWPTAAFPLQVPGYISTTTNLAVSAGGAVLAFSCSAASNATGYEAILDHYATGVWQTPVTNFTTLTSIAYANLVPCDPYEFYVVATNYSLIGLPSSTNWPFAACPAAPTITFPGYSNGLFGFSILGSPGIENLILASSNLIDWTPVATLLASNGPTPFVDSNAGSFPARFYRVVIPTNATANMRAP